jgi:hypothetical protein
MKSVKQSVELPAKSDRQSVGLPIKNSENVRKVIINN